MEASLEGRFNRISCLIVNTLATILAFIGLRVGTSKAELERESIEVKDY